MKYLRARRLTRAAETLARGAPDILAVALDAGYGSHEAFTRAFRDQFGVPPERVRERGSPEALALVAPLELQARAQPVLAPPWVTEAAVRAVGLSGRHTFDTAIGIPIQWQTFMATSYGLIPHRVDGIPIGIQIPADDEGGFDYICAAEVTAFGHVPRDLQKIEISHRAATPCSNTADMSRRSSTPMPRSGTKRWTSMAGCRLKRPSSSGIRPPSIRRPVKVDSHSGYRWRIENNE